jgi:uncharacterized protein YqjF (DUF2071 family)
VSALSQNLATISVRVRNFALITYAVPASRVRRHLPDPYELETFVDERGEERCLVSSTTFCNDGFRWSALPYPRLTFDESTYRAYVTHRGRRGVYFFRRYLSALPAFGPQKLFERNAGLGDFHIDTEMEGTRYSSYSSRVRSGDAENRFLLRAGEEPIAKPPFGTGEELAQHITYRLHGFFTSSAGVQGHMPVSHRRMAPWSGHLLDARFDTWTAHEIVSPEEVAHPYSVLVEPDIHFRLHPPRPLV